jgi:beta-phosphoglucomutase-like phosphatase (HAD superfamily)
MPHHPLPNATEPLHRADLWLFDLDGCLVDSMAATALRPHARKLLEALRSRGTPAHIWSAGGADYAARVAARVGISDVIDGYHDKVRQPDERWALPPIADGAAVVCVDDQPEGVPDGTHVVAVFPYIGHRPHDIAFAGVVAELTAERSAA